MTAARTLLACTAVLAVLLSGCAPGDDGARPADAVPDATLETFDGEPTSVHDFLGRPLVVNFWASWCAPCVEEMPDLQRVHLEVQDDVRFLGIDTRDAVGPARELLGETGVTYDVVRDPQGDASLAFGVRGMPSTFFVDADGRMQFRHTGPLTAQRLRELIDEHLLAPSSG